MPVCAQDTLSYRTEVHVNASDGQHAPLWFTSNMHGLSSERPNSGYVRAGLTYKKKLAENWSVEAALDLAGAKNHTASFIVQQAYADISWKKLTLSVGSKERGGFPLHKDPLLSSGMMVEGLNARPVPQVRITTNDYIDMPFTRKWLGLKAHIAYGVLTDGKWREEFVANGSGYMKNAVYHSKSAMLRVGNVQAFPLTMEIGILDAAQFGGSYWRKNANGKPVMIRNNSESLKSFLKALIPVQESTLENVEGNHVGSWNFALTYHGDKWKARLYYEHYFDDHSQLTWQYGRWKDGHIGVEVELPRNRFVSKMLWEGLSTYDQTGPILYDGIAGSFQDVQMSGGDNYFNHEYNWQHWGMAMGNPVLPGPVYNKDHTNVFRSSRAKAHHLGISGEPSGELSYRILLTYSRQWGTYKDPLDKIMHQFSSLYELSYAPKRLAGWSVTVGCGLDRGEYLGNSMGGAITIKKTGICFKR